ncbi:MAG TPA: hypothetical protein VI546_04755, partial [candidate division Zixibacteria bacterium]|nr:hypothetical protein [candidate division Zixibacteria bacterium]
MSFFFSFVLSKAQQVPIVNWNDFGPGELRVERFQTNQPLSVNITGMGIKPHYDKNDWDDWDDWEGREDYALAYGWILDLEIRKPIWSMARELRPGKFWGKKGTAKVEAKVNLPAGKYALYYYCGIGKDQFYYFNSDWNNGGFFEGLKRFFGNTDKYYSEKDRRKLYFTVSAEKNLFRPLAADPLEA